MGGNREMTGFVFHYQGGVIMDELFSRRNIIAFVIAVLGALVILGITILSFYRIIEIYL